MLRRVDIERPKDDFIRPLRQHLALTSVDHPVGAIPDRPTVND
jgi:hypothetical protein